MTWGKRWLIWVGVLILTAEVGWLTQAGPTPFYEPAIQGLAFVHGHAWVQAPAYVEQSRIGLYKSALMHPPLAGVVMMPVMWWEGRIDGADRYQTYVSIGLGALSVSLMWLLTEDLWLTVFYAFGTTLMYEASLGAGWDFVLVLSTIPTTLALLEVEGKRRPLLVGLWAGLAVTARYDLVLALPYYMWRLCSEE